MPVYELRSTSLALYSEVTIELTKIVAMPHVEDIILDAGKIII